MVLRRIDISNLKPVSRDAGPAPEVGFVGVADLIIDDRYQRAIERRGWANIQRIAANFDWSKFSPLMVARTDCGRFAIIDGQHRAHAAALIGVERVPALISNLSPQEQASAFSWINGAVTSLTANQVFKAALAALEPWALQCDAVVSRAGCQLMPYTASSLAKKPGQVFCIGAVRKLVEAGAGEYLQAVLDGVSRSGVRLDVRYYNAYGLAALVPPASELGIKNPDVIAGFLDAHDLDDTAKRARHLMDQKQFAGRSFKSLFGDSVRVLMKDFASRRAA